MADLAVLGAGPAGLGAAYRAARRGFEVMVLERAERVGGLAASFEVAGVRVDHGSHRLHPSIEPRIMGELTSLLGDDLQRRRRNGRIRLGGRWLAFPLRAPDLAARMPRGLALGAAWDAAWAWARRPRADTFAEVLRTGLGPTMCRRFYFPYARKLWGLEPEQLSGEQARRRVSAASPTAMLRRVITSASDDQAGVFYYPRRGYGQLAERLAEAAVAAGVDLRLGTAVRGVRPGAHGVEIATDHGAWQAGAAWSTLPLTALCTLVDPPPPAEVRAAVDGLEYRAMLLVYVVLEAPRHTRFDAHYLPEGWTPVTRISEPKNYRDATGTDPADVTVLCAEIPCDRGDAVWQLDDAAAGELVCDALARSGLPQPPVAGVAVRRLARAYPIYRVGVEQRFAAADAWIAQQPNLLTFGRQGLFAHDNAHHALAMAWGAADALGDDGRVDAASWARARQRFAEHVVED
jgi:protoporphyrinogen oxidase